MDYKTIRFERQGQVGILSLNRPERLNTLNMDMFNELRDFFVLLREDLKTRVVIVRGEGRVFCAGIDLRMFVAGAPEGEELGELQYLYHKIQQVAGEITLNMRRAPQPLIAAVRGSAAGGGLSLTLACDVRIAGESARFNAAFIRIGLSAGDMGTSYFLPRLIGLSRAAEYLYTGRFIDAETAERIGLVSRMVPDDQLEAAALDLAQEMLRTSPLGLRVSKEVLNVNIDAPSLESAIQLENRSQVLCAFTEDGKEGPHAFLEKRPPVWRDR